MKPAEWVRVYHSQAFVEFTHRSRSVVDGSSPCVCAHITPNDDPPSGMGRKPDAKWIAPLTYLQHCQLHSKGKETCERLWGVDLVKAAKAHWSRFHETEEELAA